MKIYDTEGFPNPLRVRMALAEKNALSHAEFIPVDVSQGEHRGTEFTAKNPDATVPLLELEDGTCISQCNAIIEYIDGKYEGTSLIGDTPQQRAITQMMNARVEQGLLNAVGAYFHHATDGLGKLETYQNKDWGLKQQEKALETMVYLDGVLSNQDYVAGSAFSMADITAYAGMVFADFAKIEIPTGLKHLDAWRTRIAQRASLES